MRGGRRRDILGGGGGRMGGRKKRERRAWTRGEVKVIKRFRILRPIGWIVW
jgi:hypothetical protein